MLAHLLVAILLLGGFFLIYYVGKKQSEALAEKDDRIQELEWMLTRLLDKYREVSKASASKIALGPPATDKLPADEERYYVADHLNLKGWRHRHRRPPVVSPTFDHGISLSSPAQSRTSPQGQPTHHADAA
jgi:hypothetical protein